MASLTRSQLKTSSNNTYTTNGVGDIDASEVRTFNDNLIESLITNDLTSSMNVLTSISASYATIAGGVVGGVPSLASLNAFTSSQDSKNSTLASYTASNDSTNTAQNSRLTNLESTSASVNTSIANLNTFSASNGNASLNSFTSSANSRLTSLESATASYANSASVAAVDASQQSQIDSLIAYTGSASNLTSLNAFTASQETKNSTLASYTGSNDTKWNTLGGQTGSYVTSAITASSLVTASVNLNTITFTKGDSSTFNITVNTGSGTTTDLTSLNSFTASQNTKNSTLATYTASVDTKFVAVGASTASLNSFTSSQLSINSGLNSFTASASSSLNSLNQNSSSQQSQIDSLIAATGSYALTSSIVVLTSLNDFTSSQNTKNTTLASYTGSNDTKWSNLGSQSGSFVTESETASFARTNVDNNFTANQTFTNITAVSASFTYVQTLYETSSVIYSSGSNQFGDELSDIQTLSGSVRVQGNLTVNGTPVQTSSVDISSLNAFTSSQNTKNSTLATYTASVDSSLSNINSFTASNGNTSLNAYTASQDTKNSTLASYTGSNNTKWSNLGSQSGSFITEAETGSFVKLDVANTFTQPQTINYTGGTGSLFTTDRIQTELPSTKEYGYRLKNQFGTSVVEMGQNIGDDSSGFIIVTSQNSGVTATLSKNGFVGRVDTTQFTASLAEGYVFVGDGSGKTSLVATSSFGGGSVPTGTVSSSAQILAYNIFATTGSNTFTGNQNIEAQLTASALRVENNTHLDGTLRVTNDAQFDGHILIQGASPHLKLRDTSGGGFSSGYDVRVDTGSFEIHDDTHNRNVLSDIFNSASAQHTTSLTSEIIVISGSTSVTLIGNVSASIISASTINGLGDPLAFSTSVDSRLDGLEAATSSYVTSAITASSLVTASFSGNTLTFTKGDSSTFGVVIPDISGSTIDTGSFATTGSNLFIGDQTLSDGSGNNSTISAYSGSFVLVAKGITSGSAGLSNITSSANLVNLIFKNTNANSGSLTISGSNNILLPSATPTAGFRRQVTSNNIFLTTALPEVTGSLSTYSPTITGNYGNNIIRFRGPASSSAWSMTANIVNANLNIGNADATSANQAVAGGNITTNILLAAVNYNAYTTPLVAQSVFQANLSVGNSTLTAFSSSIAANNNIFVGNTFTVNNRYFGTSSTNAAQRLSLQNNVFGGFGTPTLTAEGSNTSTSSPREAIGNTTNGGGLAIGLVLSGDNSHLYSTLIHGSNLTVTGSNAYNTQASAGSTFIGRNNDRNGTRANSGETIFAVGTGTGTGARKTGFLIDSGSNTFVEGTLNVSGSTSFNGAVNITGSLTSSLTQGYVWVGGAGNVSTLVATSSFAGGSVPAGTISSSAQITALGFVSSSVTASSLITASVNLNTITFTKGDSSTFAITVDTGSTTIPAGTVSSSAQIVAYNKFATTGSNTFNEYQIIRSNLAFQEAEGAGGSDNSIRMNSLNQATLYVSNTSISSGYNSGSVLQLTTSTGSTGYGSGSAVFQMDAVYEGNSGRMQVGTTVGLGSYVNGFADKIEFAKAGGFPNTPADTFRVDATSIELSGSVKMNTGSSGSAGIVSVGSSGTTVNNGLVTGASIILATTQELGSGDEYPAVVYNKTNGSFDLKHNFGGSLNVAYLIINPL